MGDVANLQRGSFAESEWKYSDRVKVARRWRILAAAGTVGFIFEIVGWMLLTMPLRNGSQGSCGSVLSGGGPGCDDTVRVVLTWGWGVVVLGLVALFVSLRQAWLLTEP